MSRKNDLLAEIAQVQRRLDRTLVEVSFAEDTLEDLNIQTDDLNEELEDLQAQLAELDEVPVD